MAVADEVFGRDGLDVPMPVLAAAIGVGVGSIYRQVGTKDELIGALVVERASALVERFAAALTEDDAWAALVRCTHETVDDCVGDFLSQRAWDDAAVRLPEVAAARAKATAAIDALVARARAAGALRPDASVEDLRLVFMAIRSWSTLGAEGAHRMATLVLRAMAADAPARGGAHG